MAKKDKVPKGGWLGPPPSEGLKPLRIATTNKRGKTVWKEVPQKKKDRKLRKEWNRRMAKADAKGKWDFKWPPKE